MGDVYFNGGIDPVTLSFDQPNLRAFYFYAEHTGGGLHVFTVKATDDEGVSQSIDVVAEGFFGATGFLIATEGVHNIANIQVRCDWTSYAIGEFGWGATDYALTGDINDDGLIDGLDLALLLGQWTGSFDYVPCPPIGTADLNGDCKINGNDLAILLSVWGPC